MGTTPILAIPYADPGDFLPDFPTDVDQPAAMLIESLIGVADTGWISGGSGGTIAVADTLAFTLTTSFARRVGRLCFVAIAGTMKVARSLGTTGDVGNTNLAQLVAAYRPAGAPVNLPLVTGQSGRMIAAYLQPSGWCTLSAIGGTVDLAANEAVSLSGLYIL